MSARKKRPARGLSLVGLNLRLHALERLTADKLGVAVAKVMADEVRRIVEGQLWSDTQAELARIETRLLDAVKQHSVRVEVSYTPPLTEP